MFINRDDIPDENLPDEQFLKKISEVLLADFYDEYPDFTISFVKPETIRALNKEYRGVDAVTDVLSFESGGEFDPETGLEYLGDIIICLSRAKEQSDLSAHPVENEIALLEIHGLLHLMGYDHGTDEEKQEMWQYQTEYLDKCGIIINRKPGEDFDF